jgi:starch-binding outer membrane protein, SusD/RagB family
VPGQWFTDQSCMLMRYAHVLLFDAEAKARITGPDQQAYDAINAVRTRADLPALSRLTTSAFIDAVINERAWEFAC